MTLLLTVLKQPESHHFLCMFPETQFPQGGMKKVKGHLHRQFVVLQERKPKLRELKYLSYKGQLSMLTTFCRQTYSTIHGCLLYKFCNTGKSVPLLLRYAEMQEIHGELILSKSPYSKEYLLKKCIGVQLFYNVVLVFAVQQSEEYPLLTSCLDLSISSSILSVKNISSSTQHLVKELYFYISSLLLNIFLFGADFIYSRNYFFEDGLFQSSFSLISQQAMSYQGSQNF